MKTVFSLFFLVFSFPLAAASFTEVAETTTKNLVDQILNHPFVRDIANGTLSEDTFSCFETQDNIYIRRYSDALFAMIDILEDWAFEGYALADSNLQTFLYRASISTTKSWKTPAPSQMDQCDTCRDYSNFELHSVQKCPFKGLAALAPCYLVYAKIALRLKERSVPNNSYQSWIDKYSDPGSIARSEEMASFLNQVAEKANTKKRQEMLETFHRAVSYELKFLDSAYACAQ